MMVGVSTPNCVFLSDLLYHESDFVYYANGLCCLEMFVQLQQFLFRICLIFQSQNQNYSLFHVLTSEEKLSEKTENKQKRKNMDFGTKPKVTREERINNRWDKVQSRLNAIQSSNKNQSGDEDNHEQQNKIVSKKDLENDPKSQIMESRDILDKTCDEVRKNFLERKKKTMAS
jgi:hypothetical protein